MNDSSYNVKVALNLGNFQYLSNRLKNMHFSDPILKNALKETVQAYE